jgi:hypothetical protein
VRQIISAVRVRPVLAVALAVALLGAVSPVSAQEGVRLEVTYRPDHQPGMLVLPFSASGGTDRPAGTIRSIIRQDLDFSDRFAINDNVSGIRAGDPANQRLWRERGADWVVEGAVAARGGGFTLSVTLHDVMYNQVRGRGEFDLPAAGDPNFRMAVHAVADQIVFWATGEPGMAATRIAFVMQGRGSKELYVVDSDGENLQRLTSDGSIALSPSLVAGRAARRLHLVPERCAAPLRARPRHQPRPPALGARGDQHHPGVLAGRPDASRSPRRWREHRAVHDGPEQRPRARSRRADAASTRSRRATRRTVGTSPSSPTGWASRTST